VVDGEKPGVDSTRDEGKHTSRNDPADTARPTALARRSRPGSLQVSCDSSPVSERPRTTVSVGALHPGK